MTKKIKAYIAFAFVALAFFSILFVASQYQKAGISGMTGILHDRNIAMSRTSEEAVPLSLTWISAFVLLLLAAVLIHIIKARKEHLERKGQVLRMTQT